MIVLQALPAWTLLGEYCGVVKTGEAAEEASCDCPIGFGGLRNDKLKDFCHSHPERNTEDLGALASTLLLLCALPCFAVCGSKAAFRHLCNVSTGMAIPDGRAAQVLLILGVALLGRCIQAEIWCTIHAMALGSGLTVPCVES